MLERVASWEPRKEKGFEEEGVIRCVEGCRKLRELRIDIYHEN